MSSVNMNCNNSENISPFRRDSSSSSSANLNQCQRLVGHTSHKKISSTSRGQLSQRCNSSISNTNSSSTFANSSLSLNYNINSSINNGVNNENVIPSSLLRSSLISHSKQMSIGSSNAYQNSINNYQNLSNNISSSNNINIAQTQQNQNYSKVLTSIDGNDASQKNSQNTSLSLNLNNKLHTQQSIQPTLTQLKQNAIKKYCLQQQNIQYQQSTSHSKQSQQHSQPTQNTNQNSQIPLYHFEKGVSKTHRGHTNSSNNFSYTQQQQNSSVSNVIGHSHKSSNQNQATPPNNRVNTMPSTLQVFVPPSAQQSQLHDENAINTLTSSINISTYKVSPKILKNTSNTSQSIHSQYPQQHPSIINFAQNNVANTAYGLGNNNSNQSQQNQNLYNNNSNNNNQNNNNNVSKSNQNQISSNSNNQQNGNNNSNSGSKNSIAIQIPFSQSISLKRVHSQEEQPAFEDEDDSINVERIKKEIEVCKQREVQYLTRINVLESENKQANESALKSESNIKSLKQELVKYQQQSTNLLNNTNSGSSHSNKQQQKLVNPNQESHSSNNNIINNNNNKNANVQLQQKQIAMLESYVETLSKKLQQLELEQVRQKNQNPPQQQELEKQNFQQKNKYKQLVEKYFTLEKLFSQISSENDYYKTTLNQLKAEYNHNQQNIAQTNNNHHQNEPQMQSSVLKALQLVQLNKS